MNLDRKAGIAMVGQLLVLKGDNRAHFGRLFALSIAEAFNWGYNFFWRQTIALQKLNIASLTQSFE